MCESRSASESRDGSAASANPIPAVISERKTPIHRSDARPNAIDASSDHPSIVVRSPNDPTYGTNWAAIYWKGSSSETQFFYIPEFETMVGPIVGMLLVVLFLGRRDKARKRPG